MNEGHGNDYGDDSCYALEPMQGWRYWRVRRNFWYGKEKVYSLLSPHRKSYSWRPGEVMEAECSKRNLELVAKYTARKVSLIAIGSFLLVMAVAFSSGPIASFFGAGDYNHGLQDSVKQMMTTLSLIYLIILAFSALVVLVRHATIKIRNRNGGHEVPNENCMCGLYAAHNIASLPEQYEELRDALAGKKTRRKFIIGQAHTVGNARAMEGSIGFRASSMTIAKESLYLINGTPEIAESLEERYEVPVINGNPPNL